MFISNLTSVFLPAPAGRNADGTAAPGKSILSRRRQCPARPPSSRKPRPASCGREGSRKTRFPQREDKMAQTKATAAETKTRTYVLEVTFTVDFTADDNVQSPQAIRNEARSWLESLGAAVQAINVRRAG
jgi:hypothetical protein